MDTIKEILEENRKGIRSIFNACMHKQECCEREDEIDRLREENRKLKCALFFWLPNIPAIENECTDRMANDAALLIGHGGCIDDSAEQRGWINLTPNANSNS